MSWAASRPSSRLIIFKHLLSLSLDNIPVVSCSNFLQMKMVPWLRRKQPYSMIYIPDVCDPQQCKGILANTALANVKKLIHLFRLALASSNLGEKLPATI